MEMCRLAFRTLSPYLTKRRIKGIAHQNRESTPSPELAAPRQLFLHLMTIILATPKIQTLCVTKQGSS